MKNHMHFIAAMAAAATGKPRYPIVGRGILGFWHPKSQRERFAKHTHIGYAARQKAKEQA